MRYVILKLAEKLPGIINLNFSLLVKSIFFEIIIIVLAILFAFEFENYREGLEENKLINDSYRMLLIDTKINIKVIEKTIESFDKDKKNKDSLLAKLNNNNKDVFTEFFAYYDNDKFYFRNDYYVFLKKSGKIFDNEIFKYYLTLESLSYLIDDRQKNIDKEFHNMLVLFAYKYVDLINRKIKKNADYELLKNIITVDFVSRKKLNKDLRKFLKTLLKLEKLLSKQII